MRNFKLFILQLKTAFRRVSVGLLIMAVLFGVLFGAIRLYMSTTASGDTEGETGLSGDMADSGMREGAASGGLIDVAVVSDDTVFTDYILGLTEDIPGVTGICNLIRMDMDEAVDNLSSGEVSMIIEVPDDFYEEASSMRDARLIIFTDGEPTKTEYKLLAMLGSVTGLMEITDAEILSMYDGMAAYDLPVSRSDMEWQMLSATYAGFTDRTERIDVENVSAYGSYDVIRFYLTAVVLCMIIIGSVTLFGIYGRQDIRMESAVCRGGRLALLSATVSKVCAMWISLGIWGEIIRYLLKAALINADILMDGQLIRLSTGSRFHIAIWVTALSVAVWIHFISSIIGTDTPHFRVTYVITALIMLIGAGAVIPIVYLPEPVRAVSDYIPAGALHRMLISGMWNSRRIRGLSSIEGLTVTLITDVILLGMAVLLYRRGLLKHD